MRLLTPARPLRLLTASNTGRNFAPSLAGVRPAQLATAIGASVVMGAALAAAGSWKVPIALLVAAAVTALALTRPKLFLAGFVLLRPVLAAVSNDPIVHGVSSGNADGASALLLIALAAIMFTTRRSMYRPSATGPFALVLLISVFAAAYALWTLKGVVGTDPIAELIRLTAELAVYVLAANLFSSVEQAKRLFALVALSAVVPALIGVYQWIHGAPYVPSLGVARITSTLGGGPNAFAAYLAIAAVILLGLPKLLPRWVRLPSLAVILIALVGTYSREGWVMFLVGALLLGWRERRELVVFVALATVVIVAAVPAVHNRVLPSSTPAAVTATAHSAGALDSFNWRIGTWHALLDKYSQSPVVGYGLRSTQYVNPRRNAPGGLSEPVDGFAAHNSLVQILVEGGLVLLIPYLLLLYTVFNTCIAMARSTWELHRHSVIVLVIWVAVLVAGLGADDTLGNTTLMYAVLALTGCLEGARRSLRSQATGSAAR